jgi:lipoprotein-releasing system permease protein
VSYETWIGWRYLYAGKRGQRGKGVFTTVSVLGVVLGVAALTAVLAVTTGFQDAFQEKILGVNAHITIQKPGLPFTDYRDIARRAMKADPDIVSIEPFIYRELLMTNGKGATAGISIKGVDPVSVRAVLDLEKHVIAGSLDDLEHGIVLGKQLAYKLNVGVGDEVTSVVPLDVRAKGPPTPKIHRFKVVAIFYSGFDEYDRRLTFASLREAQALIEEDELDEVQGLELKVRDLDRAEDIAAELAVELGDSFEIVGWHELNHSLFMALTLQKLILTIILTLIITVATFNMVSALTMMVTDKTPEIAILKSMGATTWSVGKVFLLVGVAITGIGTLVGVGLGLLTCYGLQAYGLRLDPKVYLIDKLPVTVRPTEVLLVCGVTLVIGIIATIVPARRAAGLRPLEGLRYD